MSIIPSGFSHLLQFYLSGPLPCPYLPGQVERKLFTRLTGDIRRDREIQSTLTRAGFRRSHDIVYRPACNECNACVPVRIPVAQFEPSRGQKRVLRTNRDLRVKRTSTTIDQDLLDLFHSYQQTRHPDSDMARMSSDDIGIMLTEGATDSFLLRLYTQDDQLLGVMITDGISDGYSAVYSFFRADVPRRSLGVQLILSLIDEARANNLPYVYLGYWIKQSTKMAYKAKFQPLQTLEPEGWIIRKDLDDR